MGAAMSEESKNTIWLLAAIAVSVATAAFAFNLGAQGRWLECGVFVCVTAACVWSAIQFGKQKVPD
jgi:ABC-type uncharacterized transport system permease subunit